MLKSEKKSIAFKCSIDFNLPTTMCSQKLAHVLYSDELLITLCTKILGLYIIKIKHLFLTNKSDFHIEDIQTYQLS